MFNLWFYNYLWSVSEILVVMLLRYITLHVYLLTGRNLCFVSTLFESIFEMLNSFLQTIDTQ